MIDYSITGTLTLPSLGKIYNCEVKPEVTLKSMTTQHEMMRLSHSDYTYKNLCDIIDDCMVEPIGISAYDVCLGDYQALLYKLRSITYGPIYKLGSVCPVCKAHIEDEINLDELKVNTWDEKFDELTEFTLPRTNKLVKLRAQSPRDFDNIISKVKDFKRKNPKALDPTIIYTACSAIETIDGKKYHDYEVDKWVRNLPAYDMNILLKKIDTVSAYINVDTSLHNTCDACGFEFDTNLALNSEFFRPEVD